MRKTVKKIDTPILFVIYKRKDTALRVLEAISKVKPNKLYISQDGPKDKNQKLIVKETLEEVVANVNWDCNLVVWTHDKNLGLKKHISEAFDRFFEKEEMGIYLEDDTLPSEDFFYFEQELLRQYKDDKRIFSINGTNFYPSETKVEGSYYLSKIGDIWGFGLWKRSWELYRSNMDDYDLVSKTANYNNYFFNRKYKFYLEMFWKAILLGKLDSWAMQLVYSAVKNNMFFIAPKVNMVNNIGSNRSASNVSVQEYYAPYTTPFPLIHPKQLKYFESNDTVYFDNMLKGGWGRLILIKLFLDLPLKTKKMLGNLVNKAL